ncbi:MAG: hypothetical protein EP329_01570 [Deltaproteobacteria bacterium]|nr:MAG: hypothetical protein EP329_01570 [Deltaproteobacteria bacterium]
MRNPIGQHLWIALGASLALTAGCGDDGPGTQTTDTQVTQDTTEGDTYDPVDSAEPADTTASDTAVADTTVADTAVADTTSPTPTLVDWLLDVERFGFVHGTYGKGTYCGAFEKGAIPGYADVRCTDGGGYAFSLDENGTLLMEETVYLHRISTQDPDGEWPWWVDDGFSGALVYRLTPMAWADVLDAGNGPDAGNFHLATEMVFEAEVIRGYGPDGYWGWLGEQGGKSRMVLARGTADDTLIDWTIAEYDGDSDSWTASGVGFPGWFVQRYPRGAFLSKACTAGTLRPGAVIDDGDGGTLDAGPGYCPPTCRMYTALDPDGANDLPVCGAADFGEAARAPDLGPGGGFDVDDRTVAEWLVDTGVFSFTHGSYGKGTYCGAFEKGAIPGFPDVRCTDTTTYAFTKYVDWTNTDRVGPLTMTESLYTHKITDPNPDGSMPWLVDNGYSGSLVWELVPVEPALPTDAQDAMEFVATVVSGTGPDGYWAWLGDSGMTQRMIFSRGQDDEVLLDWTTADYDADSDSWDEHGAGFPGWYIQRYPTGAFHGRTCGASDRIAGAVISDGAGGTLPTGPGYCAPTCRMYTALDPTGANGLPVCDAALMPDEPRAPALMLPPEPTVADWLVGQGQLAYVHGSYGKGSYCGAFEKGAIPGYEAVRCTDTSNYLFSYDDDGNLRMEEAIYTHKISVADPDGSMPWLVDGGYSGSVVWKLTPTDPGLAVDPADAMEFVAEMVEGYGPDGYWAWLGGSGTVERMILARGHGDGVLLDWATATYDADADTWADDGDAFPGWFIQRYPTGAFVGTTCAAADRVAGAQVSDGAGGFLDAGPGYCPPTCRMYTPADPDGANGLPVCAGELDEAPRAPGLAPLPEPTVAQWILDEGFFSFVHGTYGKGSYCGAFEMGAIAGYESVRCTDTGSYVFSANDDGSIRLEEAVYVNAITADNPDGGFPWFVADGYSGSLVYRLTPLDPALNANPADAMAFEAEIVDGFGPDGYWAAAAAAGGKSRMILARGQGDDALLDWTTANWDADASSWTTAGDAFPGWFIENYPAGAFFGKVCAESDRHVGAQVSDGNGGFLDPGPGYCVPECRMATEHDPSGANGLPVCEGDALAEWPRASAL